MPAGFAEAHAELRAVKRQLGVLIILYALVALPMLWLVFRVAARSGAIAL
jgi:hypothetical protein